MRFEGVCLCHGGSIYLRGAFDECRPFVYAFHVVRVCGVFAMSYGFWCECPAAV